MGLSAATIATLATTAASTAAGVYAVRQAKKNTPDIAPIDKEVQPNTDAALRNAQDMARRRKGVAANILTDGSGTTAGSVATKTLLGQ